MLFNRPPGQKQMSQKKEDTKILRILKTRANQNQLNHLLPSNSALWVLTPWFSNRLLLIKIQNYERISIWASLCKVTVETE